MQEFTPKAKLEKAIKIFPAIDYKLMGKILNKKNYWIKDKSFKKTAIDGYDKMINYENVHELGEKYVEFYNYFFPDEKNTIRTKINKTLVEEFIHSKMNQYSGFNPKYIDSVISKSVELNVPDYNEYSKVEIALDDDIFKWKLANGELPNLEPDFLLQKNEQCIYKANCELIERKTVTRRINYAGPRARIKIAKGLSYNAGSYSVGTSSETVDVSKGAGPLNLTTKRIIFKSGDKNLTILLSSIIDIQSFSDCVTISKTSGVPLSFMIKDAKRFKQLLDFAIENSKSGNFKMSNRDYDVETISSIDDAMIEVINKQGILNAVKTYKDTMDVSLREAKNYVDNLNKRLMKL